MRSFWMITAPSCKAVPGRNIERSRSREICESSLTPLSINVRSPISRSTTIKAPVCSRDNEPRARQNFGGEFRTSVTAKEALPAKTGQRSADFRLEQHDNGDGRIRGKRREQRPQCLQSRAQGDFISDDDSENAHQNVRGARAPHDLKQLINDEGDRQDIDHGGDGQGRNRKQQRGRHRDVWLAAVYRPLRQSHKKVTKRGGQTAFIGAMRSWLVYCVCNTESRAV